MDVLSISFVGLVLELLIFGANSELCPSFVLFYALLGVYCVLFAGTVWVLVKRRRESGTTSISWVIDICSWFIFITLSMV